MLMLLAMASCKDDKDDANAVKPSAQPGFYFAENGSATQVKTDDAWANGAYNSIIAQSSNATVIEINAKSLAAGTYSLSDRYAFTYIKGGNWEGTAGTLIITKNQDGKLSGTFEATAGSGVAGVTSVKGSFTDIPVK